MDFVREARDRDGKLLIGRRCKYLYQMKRIAELHEAINNGCKSLKDWNKEDLQKIQKIVDTIDSGDYEE